MSRLYTLPLASRLAGNFLPHKLGSKWQVRQCTPVPRDLYIAGSRAEELENGICPMFCFAWQLTYTANDLPVMHE